MDAAPRFTVVLPVEDDRGLVENALRGWNAQTFPRAEVEIVLTTGAEDAAARARLAPLLAPQDRWCFTPEGNFSARYHNAAQMARAAHILFTESHCVPEPELLAEVDAHLRAAQPAGICCRSVGIVENEMSRLDQTLHDEGIAVFSRVEDWRKVDIHAFVIARDAYFAAGGFDATYDRFSERILALRLHELGYQLDYLPTAVVRHKYRTTWRELFEDFHAYTRGEVLYRWAHPGPDRVNFTYFEGAYYPGSEETPFRYSPAAHELARDLSRVACVPRAQKRFAQKWSSFVRFGPRGARRGRFARLAARVCGVWLGRATGIGLERHYRALWKHGLWWGGLRALANEKLPEPPDHDAKVAVDAIHETDLFNWHGYESFEGHAMRWSDELSALRLRIPACDARVRWALHGLRWDLAPPDVRFFVNGKPLPPDRVRLSREVLELELRAADLNPRGGQRLSFYVRPLCPWRNGAPADRRRLGLPLFGLSIERAGAVRVAA
jgi:GT2 family glycosyltransferase